MIGRPSALLVFVVGAIVYGSLYPFDFHPSGDPLDALVHFLSTWKQPPQSRGDVLANILLYMPLGLIFVLWLRQRRGTIASVFICVIAGAVLSLAMELSQYFDTGRVSCISDLYLNSLGSFFGALLGSVWHHKLDNFQLIIPQNSSFIMLVLLAWLGWRLFPYEPTIDLHKYWDSLKPVFQTPSLTPYDLFRYTLMWVVVGCLAQSALTLKARSPFLAFAALFVLLAKVLIVGLVVTVSELVGATIAVGLIWCGLEMRSPTAIRMTTGLFFLAVVMERLEPWQIAPVARAFGWIPFFNILHGSLSVDIQSFLQKYFLYGALLWLLVSAGLSLVWATAVECTMLLATSLIQTHLVGRSGEITDSVFAAAIAVVYCATSSRGGAKARSL